MIAWLKQLYVKRGVWAATAAQLAIIAVRRVLNIFGRDGWVMFSDTGDAGVVDIRQASESL